MILCLFSMTLSACTNRNKSTSETKNAVYFDTIISLTLYDQDAGNTDLFDGAFSLAKKYDKLLNASDPDSEISLINNHAPEAVPVSDDTIEVLQKGLDYSASSGGKFDITIGKLSSLWNISSVADGTSKPAIPSEDDIKACLSHVNYKNVVIEGNSVSLSDSEAAIDLGGIAKGFIADKMKDYLISQGVTSALINLGGNVLTIGSRPDGEAYNIGIQEPFSEDGSVITSLPLRDKTAVTSGNYQRYFKLDGKIYHHILDLTTGYPADTDLNSVTIITDSSTDADALSTMIFIMGLNEGSDYVESLDGVEAIFIDKDNHVTATSGVKLAD